ncbi:hypothetical protein [Streptomyces sp.]|uniref:hypothetical protein n=1 Tax=Streptomyces sp. TaxID=1931 RepID=UPI002F41D847
MSEGAGRAGALTCRQCTPHPAHGIGIGIGIGGHQQLGEAFALACPPERVWKLPEDEDYSNNAGTAAA